MFLCLTLRTFQLWLVVELNTFLHPTRGLLNKGFKARIPRIRGFKTPLSIITEVIFVHFLILKFSYVLKWIQFLLDMICKYLVK